jgi:hypothetical protein
VHKEPEPAHSAQGDEQLIHFRLEFTYWLLGQLVQVEAAPLQVAQLELQGKQELPTK